MRSDKPRRAWLILLISPASIYARSEEDLLAGASINTNADRAARRLLQPSSCLAGYEVRK